MNWKLIVAIIIGNIVRRWITAHLFNNDNSEEVSQKEGGDCGRRKYKEIFRLKEKLEKENISFEFREILSGFQINYPNIRNRQCSVVEHECSYGHERDLLEIMGLLSDEEEADDFVLGHLTAEDVFNRIYKHFKEN